MSRPAADDIGQRIAGWVPTLLFLLGIYSRDQDAAVAMLEPGMPLFDACPIDVTLAWLTTADLIASVGDVGPDQLADLLRSFGGEMLSDPPTTGDAT